MSRYFSLNCTASYFFSSLGEILNLEEGDPIEVHQALIKMIQSAFNIAKETNSSFCKNEMGIIPGVQMNTRDFYFREPGMIDEILKIYHDSKPYVLPSIHQANDAQPLINNKDFILQLKQNCDLARKIQSKNITIHLPVQKSDDTKNIIEILTNSEILSIIRGPKDSFQVSVDLENNHHNSFFGNLYNCINLLDQLDDKLIESGNKDLCHQINFCFDYGHYITQSYYMEYNKREMIADFFKQKADRIKTLHLHNNDGIGKDQHILIGQEPDITGKIGNIKVDRKKLREHQEILLESLPLLNLKHKDNWNIVTETDRPYTKDILANSIETIYRHL